MSCDICGRTEADGGGHHLGCVALLRQHARALVEPDFSGALCDFDGCHNPKASASPRAKWCTEHQDPKNRKE